MIFTISCASSGKKQPHPRAVKREWVERTVIESPVWIKDGQIVHPWEYTNDGTSWDAFMAQNYPNGAVVGNNFEYDKSNIEYTIEIADLADLLTVQAESGSELILDGPTLLVYDDYLE